jgi:hypothetical protein
MKTQEVIKKDRTKIGENGRSDKAFEQERGRP